MKNHFSRNLGLLLGPLAVVALSGCTRDYKFQPVDMWNNSRLRPMSQVNFFDDKSASRVPPAFTVARGQDRLDEAVYYGTQNGTLITYNPVWEKETNPEGKLALLERGQERYQIYCQPCHGLAGYGDGMIVRRGFAVPPSYHIQRLINAPDGHFFDVMTNGYGAMYSYASRVSPRDRWAIVAYIRALQRAGHATGASIPAGAAGVGPQPALPEAEGVPVTPTFGATPTPIPAPANLSPFTNPPASSPPQFGGESGQ